MPPDCAHHARTSRSRCSRQPRVATAATGNSWTATAKLIDKFATLLLTIMHACTLMEDSQRMQRSDLHPQQLPALEGLRFTLIAC